MSVLRSVNSVTGRVSDPEHRPCPVAVSGEERVLRSRRLWRRRFAYNPRRRRRRLPGSARHPKPHGGEIARVKKVLFHLHRKRLLQPDGSGAIQCASRGSGSPLPGGEHGDRGP
jgi:hypothetical protein